MAEGATTFRADGGDYDRYMGRYSRLLAPQLVGLAGLRPGDRALDVGCGPGPLTAELVALLGTDAVAAIDPSEPFVAACRERHPGVDARLGAAEALPFADDTFDAALAQLVVQFMSDRPAGVAEMRRVVRPGGRVVACVWDYAEGMRMVRTFWDAALALDPDAADEAAAMAHSTREHLEELWLGAGLRDVDTGALTVTVAYDDFDDLWNPFTRGIGPAGAYCAALPPAERDALRAELHRRLGEPVGPLRLDARAWYAVGTV